MDKTIVEQSPTGTGTKTTETTTPTAVASTQKPSFVERLRETLGINMIAPTQPTIENTVPLQPSLTQEIQPLQSAPETSAVNVMSQPTIDMQPIQPTNEGPTPLAEQQATTEIPTTDFQPAQPIAEKQTPPAESTETFGSRLDSGKPFDEYPFPQSQQTDNLSNVNTDPQDPNLTTETVTNETHESSTQAAVEPAPSPVSEPPAIPDSGIVTKETTPASDINPLSERPTFVTEPVTDQVTSTETTTATSDAVTPPEPIKDATVVTPTSSNIAPSLTSLETPTETAPISSLGPMPLIGGEGSTTSSQDNPTTQPISADNITPGIPIQDVKFKMS